MEASRGDIRPEVVLDSGECDEGDAFLSLAQGARRAAPLIKAATHPGLSVCLFCPIIHTNLKSPGQTSLQAVPASITMMSEPSCMREVFKSYCLAA